MTGITGNVDTELKNPISQSEVQTSAKADGIAYKLDTFSNFTIVVIAIVFFLVIVFHKTKKYRMPRLAVVSHWPGLFLEVASMCSTLVFSLCLAFSEFGPAMVAATLGDDQAAVVHQFLKSMLQTNGAMMFVIGVYMVLNIGIQFARLYTKEAQLSDEVATQEVTAATQ